MKKLLVFFSLFFALLVVQGQNQISELSKGLIFSTHLDEWGQGRDEVSGVMPTKTDVYNVLDRQGSGRRSLEYNGTSSYTTLPAIPAFGTGDFTVIMKVKLSSLVSMTFISGVAGSFAIRYDEGGSWYSGLTNATLVAGSTTSLVAGVETVIGYKRTGTTGTYYVNGNIAGTCTDNLDYLASTYLGRFLNGQYGLYMNGSISMCRIFNNSTVDITYYSRPENPIKAADLTACKLNLNAEGLAQSTSGYWYDRTNSTAASGYTSVAATNSGTTLVIPPASNLGVMAFNGTMSNVDYGIPPTNILSSTTGTISFWCNINSFPVNLACILSLCDINTYSLIRFTIKSNGSVYADSYAYSSAIYWYVSTPAGLVALNTPTNVIITQNGIGVKIYINAVSQILTLGLNAGNWFSSLTNINHMYIGVDRTNNLGFEFFFNGNVSNINIWNRILSQDEITLVKDVGF